MRYRTQVLLLVASVALICAGGVAWTSYRSARALLLQTLEAQVRALATSAAASINLDVHDRARQVGTVDSPEYRLIEGDLRRLRDQWRGAGLDVRYVYTLAPDPRAPLGLVYGIDAEEPGPNKSLPGSALSANGTFGYSRNMEGPEASMSSDEFGEMLTGAAPLRGLDGRLAAIVSVDLPLSSVRALERSLLLSGGIAATGVLVIALLAAWIVVGRIVGPLERLRRLAGAFAEGELTAGAETHGAKEVEALAESLESLRCALCGIVGRITEASICANESCHTITDQAASERSRAASAASNAVEAAGRAGEIATTARTLADAASELRSTASTIIATGAEGIENLRGIADGVDQLRTTGDGLAAQLDALRERAKAVDALLDAMVAVADRSNLLSLNAEIEASKAGEAGRGFMVVAGEIRRLAEQAAASALQIEGNVQRMHDAVGAGVVATQDLARSLAIGAERAQHGTDLLQSSVNGLESLAPRIASIADASERQREGADFISRALGEIAESATNALSFFESVEGMLTDLRSRGAVLAEAVRRFRT